MGGVERLHLPIDQLNSLRGITFAELAQNYAEQELVEQTESIHAKAHTTVHPTNELSEDSWLMTTHYNSGSTTFATGSLRFSSASELIQEP